MDWLLKVTLLLISELQSVTHSKKCKHQLASGMLPTDMFILTTGLCKLRVVSVASAMAQVVSWYPVIPEVRILSSVSSCWICGGYISTRTGFSSDTSIFPFYSHSTGAPYSYFIYLPSVLYNLSI